MRRNPHQIKGWQVLILLLATALLCLSKDDSDPLPASAAEPTVHNIRTAHDSDVLELHASGKDVR